MNMNRLKGVCNNSGFSLLEMIIATAVSSIILLMVYSAHRSIMTSIYDLTGVADFYENINLAMNRIDKDLSYAYFSRYNTKITFIGENSSGTFSNGRLNFVTAEYNDMMLAVNPKAPLPRSDIHEVGYSLLQDKTKPGLFSLMRRQDIHYDNNPETGGAESVLLENVVDVKFEFRQRNEWEEKWDSRDDQKYPQAVRTTLKVKNYRGSDEEFVVLSFINPVN